MPTTGPTPPAPYFPAELANLDVLGLIVRLDRVYIEAAHCQSADQASGLFGFDAARLRDYIDDYRLYWEYVQSRPIPDSPEAHGVVRWVVPAWPPQVNGKNSPAPEEIENDDISQILRQLIVYRMEMANSQSARMTQGFLGTPEGQPGDRTRFADAITRLENMLNWVAETQPSDRPESTPKALPTPPGRLGA